MAKQSNRASVASAGMASLGSSNQVITMAELFDVDCPSPLANGHVYTFVWLSFPSMGRAVPARGGS